MLRMYSKMNNVYRIARNLIRNIVLRLAFGAGDLFVSDDGFARTKGGGVFA